MDHITRHLRYNVWANERIAEVLTGVDEEILFHERKSSFTSIAKTVMHMRDAEQVWLKRLQGTSLTAFPSAGKTIAKDELIEAFTNSSRELLSVIESKDDSFLHSQCEYRNLKGQPFADVVADILLHVVNHGAYHRGQIITMLREAGVAPLPATDFILYLRTAR